MLGALSVPIKNFGSPIVVVCKYSTLHNFFLCTSSTTSYVFYAVRTLITCNIRKYVKVKLISQELYLLGLGVRSWGSWVRKGEGEG